MPHKFCLTLDKVSHSHLLFIFCYVYFWLFNSYIKQFTILWLQLSPNEALAEKARPDEKFHDSHSKPER